MLSNQNLTRAASPFRRQIDSISLIGRVTSVARLRCAIIGGFHFINASFSIFVLLLRICRCSFHLGALLTRNLPLDEYFQYATLRGPRLYCFFFRLHTAFLQSPIYHSSSMLYGYDKNTIRVYIR